jgi:hypothetical protein
MSAFLSDTVGIATTRVSRIWTARRTNFGAGSKLGVSFNHGRLTTSAWRANPLQRACEAGQANRFRCRESAHFCCRRSGT